MCVNEKSIRKRPRVFYENLTKTLNHPEPEATHYMERLMQLA